jgi:hypothetical protein
MPCRGCLGKAKYGVCDSCGERWCAACVKARRAVAPYRGGTVLCDTCGKGFFGAQLDMDAQLLRDCRETSKAGSVECLLRAKASANTCAKMASNGSTALHVAAAACNAPAVLLLLQHHADPAQLDAEGNTPLHTASKVGDTNLKAVTILVRAARESLMTQNNATFKPIDLASRHQFKRLESLLQREMARIHREDNQQRQQPTQTQTQSQTHTQTRAHTPTQTACVTQDIAPAPEGGETE